MSKFLIIAEKPSVAADIARALGGFTKNEDYFENDQYIVCSAVGHLLELVCPEEFEVKRGKWTFNHLPVIPQYFDLKPVEKSLGKLNTIKKLAKRKEVSGLINACDAGREGELIFNYIVRYLQIKLPVQRLWLQSMTKDAISNGFKSLRKGSDLKGLADAAVCRSESDWLVGINGTRAMTAFNSKSGGFFLTTVGRVQTPTLAIVVDREKKIKNFVAEKYWEVVVNFAAKNGTYQGKWFDVNFKAVADKEHQRADRIWQQKLADKIVEQCAKQTGVANDVAKLETRLSPLLFDLTSLQREANQKFGFSAKITLSIAQSLYEKHKLITYPRTDSRHLPEDYLATVNDIVGELKKGSGDSAKYSGFASKILSEKWLKLNKRIFDNKKVSDHFAIIPTVQSSGSINEIEGKIYDLIVKRFLAVFYPAAEYLTTFRTTLVGEHSFKTEGKILKYAGWQEIYGKEVTEDDTSLVAIEKNEQVKVKDIEKNNLETRPPPRYNEATLLSAMEGAGKMISDEELQQAMSGRGLGTPATRAQIIENLIGEKYIFREGKELVPTAKSFSLQTLLNGLQISELTSPELTGEWEWKLGRIESGEFSREQFMLEIETMTKKIVEQTKRYESDSVPGDYVELERACPLCNSKIVENYKKYQCCNCAYEISKTIAGRLMSAAEVNQILTNGEIGPLDGFRSKMGRNFSARLVLNEQKMVTFEFDNKDSVVDYSLLPEVNVIGKCPLCNARVFNTDKNYSCENTAIENKPCSFKLSKTILGQAIDEVQAKKLINKEKTDLLKSFVSSRTKRKFSAYLALDEKNKLNFEFEKSATPAKGKGKAKSKAAAES